MRKNLLKIVAVGILAATLFGCGGQGSMVTQERGEGNIPIGRMPDPFVEGTLAVSDSKGVRQMVRSTNGTFWVAPLASGPAKFIVTSSNPNLKPVQFTATIGLNQRYIFKARFPRIRRIQIPVDLNIGIQEGTQLEVGRRYPIRITTNLEGRTLVLPTVYINNGVGSLDDLDRMTVLVRGRGEIVTVYEDQENSVRFTTR
ncbi:MAG: hypothetical protein KIT11_11340 [Fimbriimonadaceae bacterium]|nr:hypothetical protein [Fimbriimonadaceae bacterium]QYK55374.1 MAG: hypothetical protein KF733_10195 [Fimbriimonadaceae bacterium]